jgi:hypothetical protein
MLHKKISRLAIVVSSLLLSCLAVASENNSQEQAGLSAMGSQVGLYTGFIGGGYYRNMKDNLALAGAIKFSGNQPISTEWGWGHGAFDLGLNIGYQFTNELSLEMGTIYMQSQKLKFNSGSGSNTSGTYCNNVYCYASGSFNKLSTWASYFGLKAQTALIDQLSIYAKLAAAYIDTRYRIHLASGSQLVGGGNASGDYASDSTYWAPAIALGAEYRLTEKWRASAQYMLIMNGNSLSGDPATVNSAISTINNIALPSIQLFTLGIEYQFVA